MTAEKLLEKLSREGGVIVSSNDVSTTGIAIAQACGRFYVNKDNAELCGGPSGPSERAPGYASAPKTEE